MGGKQCYAMNFLPALVSVISEVPRDRYILINPSIWLVKDGLFFYKSCRNF